MSPKSDTPGEHKGVWVFIEHRNEKPAPVSLELLGEGRRLAGMLGAEVTALILSEKPEDQAQELVFYGADAVIAAADPALRDYRTELYTTIIVDQVLKGKPEILLMGATCIGRDLAPR